jgi:hypothetical protein
LPLHFFRHDDAGKADAEKENRGRDERVLTAARAAALVVRADRAPLCVAKQGRTRRLDSLQMDVSILVKV